MAINVSARKFQLLVGGQDWSAAMLEAQLDTTELSQSGLITTGGTITLVAVRELPGSLDDRGNPLWSVGQAIALDVSDSRGVLDRHPVGALRIKSSEYNYETRRLTLQVCCLLTLLSFKQPTEPQDGQDPESIESASNSRLHIVTQLLNKAGIAAINCPYSIPYPINYLVEPQGSYLETAGKILYSAGYVAWIDRYEVCQIKPVSLAGSGGVAITIGGSSGQELWYRRLSGSEGPREIIKVRGGAKIAQLPKYPKNTTRIRRAAASTIDPALSNDEVVVEEEFITEEYSEKSKKLTTNRRINRAIGLVLPDIEYNSPGDKLNLIEAEIHEEERQFELNDDDEDSKLLTIHTRILRESRAILSEYIKYKKESGIEVITGGVILAEETFVDYSYDAKDRPTSVKTTKLEHIATLLSGTNEDWGVYATSPTGLKRSEFTIESWSQRRINEWAHEVSTQKTYARIKSELITADTTTAQKLALITDDSGSIYEVSNSGQTTPPAPERCPSEASFSDKQVGGKAEFSSLGGNPYKERERVYQIEYLQGRKQTESDVDYSSNEEDEWSDPQCEKIAQLEGQLLYGRSKGQDIGLSLQDEFFDWEPLMRIVAIEPSGVRRVFATDDAHWYLGAEKALCNFGCIWVGDLRGEELKLPYQYKLYPTGIGNDGYIGNSAGVGNER